MKRPEAGNRALAQLLVWLGSRIVPSGGRSEWMAEWNAELCHVCRSGGCDPVQFARGALRDALWLQADSLISGVNSRFPRGSAWRCLANLLLLGAAGLLLCLSLPGTRRAFTVALSRSPANLVIVSSDGYAGTQFPSIPLRDYREWRADASHLFTQIAFFRPVVRQVSLGGHPPADLAVAVASENVLRVLNYSEAAARPGGRRELFLSRSAWRSEFHSDPGLIGTTAVVGGEPAVIAGILPGRGWRLPGQVEALLTENSDELDSLPSSANGFVLARIRRSAFASDRNGWCTMLEQRGDEYLRFQCIPFAYAFNLPIGIFLLALLTACIALPATTALRLGDYPERHGVRARRLNVRPWAFLLAKFALVVLVVGLWSFVFAYGDAAVGSLASLYVQMGTTFPALLFAFRWTLHDQRQRCPVCLRLLTNPARVGQPSCNFLDWCGTEWICRSGHGVLHIPELPTCWFSTQRWLRLDASWASLFPADAAAP